jgi:guanylate kinase
MKFTSERQPVIALCGPSGVGKGYTKQRIQESMPGDSFAEPVVVTTRSARHDDGPSRRAGLSEEAFSRLVVAGEVILDHRPFRTLDTPRYGFDIKSTQTESPLLTEVHSTILDDFRMQFIDQKVLMIGIVASKDTLRENILSRQSPSSDVDMRLRLGALEEQEIREAYGSGIIDDLVFYDTHDRDASQQFIINRVLTYMKEHNDRI